MAKVLRPFTGASSRWSWMARRWLPYQRRRRALQVRRSEVPDGRGHLPEPGHSIQQAKYETSPSRWAWRPRRSSGTGSRPPSTTRSRAAQRAIVVYDFKHRERQRRSFYNALISEIGFPRSTPAPRRRTMTVKISPSGCVSRRRRSARGGVTYARTSCRSRRCGSAPTSPSRSIASRATVADDRLLMANPSTLACFSDGSP